MKKLAIAEPSLIPDLREDEEYAPAAALLAALSRRDEQIRDVIALIELQQYLAPRAFDPKSPNDVAQRQRLRMLQTRVKVNEIYEPVATAGAQPAIGKALKLLEGVDVPPPLTPAARLEQCRRHLAVLDEAIRAQSEVLENIRATKALELAKRPARRNDDLLVAHYRAAQELARTTAAVRELHAEVMRAGYGPPRSDFMPAYLARGALLLGEETVHGSDISTVRRQLEQRGLLG